MAGKKDKFALTEDQQLFVDAFIGEAALDKTKAAAIAKAQTGRSIHSGRMLGSEAVQRAIHLAMNDATFWLNEGVIIDKLFNEGLHANSASARVNALVWVGKHIGMWKEKVEDQSITYQIVNYGVGKEDMAKTIDAQDIQEKDQQVVLPEGVVIANYSNKEPH